jgi:hypothetical protein
MNTENSSDLNDNTVYYYIVGITKFSIIFPTKHKLADKPIIQMATHPPGLDFNAISNKNTNCSGDEFVEFEINGCDISEFRHTRHSCCTPDSTKEDEINENWTDTIKIPKKDINEYVDPVTGKIHECRVIQNYLDTSSGNFAIGKEYAIGVEDSHGRIYDSDMFVGCCYDTAVINSITLKKLNTTSSPKTEQNISKKTIDVE